MITTNRRRIWRSGALQVSSLQWSESQISVFVWFNMHVIAMWQIFLTSLCHIFGFMQWIKLDRNEVLVPDGGLEYQGWGERTHIHYTVFQCGKHPWYQHVIFWIQRMRRMWEPYVVLGMRLDQLECHQVRCKEATSLLKTLWSTSINRWCTW